MSLRRTAAVALALTCSAVFPLGLPRLGAATAFIQRAFFDARTDVVRLDVSVLDRDRRPVGDLSASDFTVLENGEPRRVWVFERVTLPVSPSVTAQWQTEIAPDVVANELPDDGRLVIIALDRTVGLEDSRLARAIANRVIDLLGPNDLAAVVFTIEFGNLRTPQNFTSDKTRLRAAVARPFAGTGSGEGLGSDRGGCPCGTCVMENLTHAAATVRDVPGRRKQMFFISTAFADAAGGLFGGTGIASNRGVSCSFPLREARTALIREAGLSNLTIHTVDPSGLKGTNRGHFLADMTGGRSVAGTNAPESVVPEILAESQSYYLIGFEPADRDAPGRLRKIEVTVSRPDVQVLARTAYYPTDVSKSRRRTARDRESLAESIDGVLPAPDVPLRIAAAAFAEAGSDGTTVVVMTGLGVRANETSSRVVRTLTAAFDSTGRQVGRTVSNTLEITPPDGLAGEVALRTGLSLRPGRYEIRVAVEENATGLRGSVFTFVDVPDFARDRLSMSDILIERVAPSTGGSPGVTPLVLPILPREFAQTEQVAARVRFHQGGSNTLAPVSVLASVVDDQDRPVYQARALVEEQQFSSARRTDYVLALPLSSLSPGEYLLRLEGSLGDRAVNRSLRFEVR